MAIKLREPEVSLLAWLEKNPCAKQTPKVLASMTPEGREIGERIVRRDPKRFTSNILEWRGRMSEELKVVTTAAKEELYRVAKEYLRCHPGRVQEIATAIGVSRHTFLDWAEGANLAEDATANEKARLIQEYRE